jgi:phage terminase large subunit GpA-like protein
LLNANALKDALFGRLESVNPGKGMFRYPNWLPDFWYSEICAEIRTDKGWQPTNQRRNEAIDLSYYALGACVSVLIRAEGINWQNPPGWAKPWDQGNDLVFAPVVPGAKSFDTAPETAYTFDFEALGKTLG